jgi:ribosomal protein S13
MSLSDVINGGATDDVIGMMKVSELLACLPDVGKAGAAQVMERLGIAESRRVRSLAQRQREALTGEFSRVQLPLHSRPPSCPSSPPEERGNVASGSAEMISAQDLIVAADHGQIYIFSIAGEEEDEDFDPDEGHLIPALNDATQSGRFVGVQPGIIDLLTPGQWNFRTPLRLETWSAEPPDDRDGWDHEVDADFDVPDGRINFMQSGAGTADVSIDIPEGRYRARISGRGFTALGHAGANGDDSYRLRLWPRGQQEDPALRKRWPGWDQYR